MLSLSGASLVSKFVWHTACIHFLFSHFGKEWSWSFPVRVTFCLLVTASWLCCYYQSYNNTLKHTVYQTERNTKETSAKTCLACHLWVCCSIRKNTRFVSFPTATGPTAVKHQCPTSGRNASLPFPMGSGLCSTSPPISTPHKRPSCAAKRPTPGRASKSFCSWKLKQCYWQQKRTTSPAQCSEETWSEGALYHLPIVPPTFPSLSLFSSLTNRFVTTPWPKTLNIFYLLCSSPLPSLLSSCLLGCICILFVRVPIGTPFSWPFHVAFILQNFLFRTL